MPYRLFNSDRPDSKKTDFFLLRAYFENELVGVSEHRMGSPEQSNHNELNDMYAALIKSHCEKAGKKLVMTRAYFQTSPIMENEKGQRFYMEWVNSSNGYNKTLVKDKVKFFKQGFLSNFCNTCLRPL